VRSARAAFRDLAGRHRILLLDSGDAHGRCAGFASDADVISLVLLIPLKEPGMDKITVAVLQIG
jgi:hypothetical protein